MTIKSNDKIADIALFISPSPPFKKFNQLVSPFRIIISPMKKSNNFLNLTTLPIFSDMLKVFIQLEILLPYPFISCPVAKGGEME